MRSIARISKSMKAHEKGLDKDFADLLKILDREQKTSKVVAKKGRPAKVKTVKTKKAAKATGAKRGRPPGSKNKTEAPVEAPAIIAPVVDQVPATV